MCVAVDTTKNLFSSRGSDKDDEMGHQFIGGLFNGISLSQITQFIPIHRQQDAQVGLDFEGHGQRQRQFQF